MNSATPAPESPNVERQSHADRIDALACEVMADCGLSEFGNSRVYAKITARLYQWAAASQGAAQAPSSIDSADVYSKSIGAAQAPYYKTHEPPHCPTCNCGEAQEAPSADRDAKAVAFVSAQGLIDLAEGLAITAFPRAVGRLTIPVYTAPPAQPASPGPLQPEASRVIAAARALSEKLKIVHDSPEYHGIWNCAYVHGLRYSGPIYERELAEMRAALSADHDAKAAK